MAICYQNIEELEASAQAYKKAITIKPDYPEALNNFGIVLRKQNKLDEALKLYEKAIAIKPDYSEALNNLGLTFKEKQKYNEAIEAYEKALKIKPDFVEVYNNLGLTLRDQGKLEEAIEAYEKALKIKPDFATAKQNLTQLLKICSPKNQGDNFLIRVDKSIKSNRALHCTEVTDFELSSTLLMYLKEINEADQFIKTDLSQIYRRNKVDLNCKRHISIFNKNKIIPEFCFGCFKVQIEVVNLLDLIKLVSFFYQVDFKFNLARKCLVEMRPEIYGSYKGLIYCRGVEEANNVKRELEEALRVFE